MAALPANLLPGPCLAIGQGISSRSAAEPVGSSSVPIGSATAMLRIVLPTGISSAVSPAAVAAAANWLIGRAVTTNIRVTIEIVVVVDVVVAPTTAPSPAAAPKCPHHHAHTKRDGEPRRIISGRRIINGWVG